MNIRTFLLVAGIIGIAVTWWFCLDKADRDVITTVIKMHWGRVVGVIALLGGIAFISYHLP